MGGAGEADKKRRHVSAVSPTAAAAAKKQSFMPLSEEKKLDMVVLQFQNKKLKQKLETQKDEISSLESKIFQVQDRQKSHEKVLNLVKDSWEKEVSDLESHSKHTLGVVKHGRHFACALSKEGIDVCMEDVLLSRILEKGGASESTIANLDESGSNHDEIDKRMENIFSNTLASFDELNCLKHMLYVASLNAATLHGQSQVVSSDLHSVAKNLRMEVLKLHLKHKSISSELQNHRDTEAKNKATLRHLKGELESNLSNLDEINRDLAILYAERDSGKGVFSLSLNRENKPTCPDEVRKQDDVPDMELTLKELMKQSNLRMSDLSHIHEERLMLLDQLSKLQSNLKNVKRICAAQPFLKLKDQLSKAKADFILYQSLCENLQVEKESLSWKEKENHMKDELVDVLRVSSAVAEFRISELELEIQRYVEGKNLIETKLREGPKDPGRKEIITGFKALVSSFPERMGYMQNQLASHKEASAEIHCLRANVMSLTNILNRKGKELESLRHNSTQRVSEIKRLQVVVQDLKSIEENLKHSVEKHQNQSTDSRELSEVRNSEMKAWAHVQALQSSLDERNLELRVKLAIEAEAKAQQRLAASEAEIVELRQKLEAAKRDKASLTDVLKSKHEETVAYLSEIETIDQACGDMQTQNQQLLQQVTEIDDYNIKLVLEGLRARQMCESLLMEKRMLENSVHHSRKTADFYNIKAGRIEDQLRSYMDHLQRLSEDRAHNTASLANIEKRLSGARTSSDELMTKLEEAQLQVDQSRSVLTGTQIELENERFERRRVEEDLTSLRRKAEQLRSELESSVVITKLRGELKEYQEILKCSVCNERRKEVVITKCYHLFCNPCVQKVIETRHRKCPTCAASFGVNDVKLVYI